MKKPVERAPERMPDRTVNKPPVAPQPVSVDDPLHPDHPNAPPSAEQVARNLEVNGLVTTAALRIGNTVLTEDQLKKLLNLVGESR